jgi:hypothetical protein
VTNEIERILGRPASDFTSWANDHEDDFRLDCRDLIERQGLIGPTALACLARIHPASLTGILDRLRRDRSAVWRRRRWRSARGPGAGCRRASAAGRAAAGD